MNSSINFWGIGAQKAGTTWLHDQLSLREEFLVPPVKELHYFDKALKYPSRSPIGIPLKKRFKNKRVREQALKDFKNSLPQLKELSFCLRYYFTTNPNDNWYNRLLKNSEKYTGEITPSYAILDPEDITRMHSMSPKAKIIYIVRDPIDRAWSHFRFSQRDSKTFHNSTSQIKNVIDFINSDSQQQRSDYIKTIRNFSKVFPKNQILIVFFDAIKTDPDGLMRDVIDFISDGNISINDSDSTPNKISNQSKSLTCPPEIIDFIKEKYYHQIKSLSNEYGNYFNLWLQKNYAGYGNQSLAKVTPTLRLKQK
ncbi:Sulfotransferase domain superfamily [Verrucomicrobiia bacterium DG1235]|nr:Sulfotransferase domain superfamily [Verrucomicrobiae bacterium DG1235]